MFIIHVLSSHLFFFIFLPLPPSLPFHYALYPRCFPLSRFLSSSSLSSPFTASFCAVHPLLKNNRKSREPHFFYLIVQDFEDGFRSSKMEGYRENFIFYPSAQDCRGVFSSSKGRELIRANESQLKTQKWGQKTRITWRKQTDKDEGVTKADGREEGQK